mmetsp:Transcript_25543/g.84407  ORF Transcript_25543/g.84407 Transcript_25543/m.84407 type:complete len:207 (-) Transcript_25543:501-1121(-)
MAIGVLAPLRAHRPSSFHSSLSTHSVCGGTGLRGGLAMCFPKAALMSTACLSRGSCDGESKMQLLEPMRWSASVSSMRKCMIDWPASWALRWFLKRKIKRRMRRKSRILSATRGTHSCTPFIVEGMRMRKVTVKRQRRATAMSKMLDLERKKLVGLPSAMYRIITSLTSIATMKSSSPMNQVVCGDRCGSARVTTSSTTVTRIMRP